MIEFMGEHVENVEIPFIAIFYQFCQACYDKTMLRTGMKLSGIQITRHDLQYYVYIISEHMTTRKMLLFADYRYAIPTVNFTEDAGR